MDNQHIHINILIISMWLRVSACAVILFSMKPESKSLSGSRVELICERDPTTYATTIIKTDSKNVVASDLHIIVCGQSNCETTRTDLYTAKANATIIVITIFNLQRSEEQKWWTCRTPTSDSTRSEKQFYLTVYTEPKEVFFITTSSCDLAVKQCSFTCQTRSCTYPIPTFKWYYSLHNGDTTRIFGNFSQTTSEIQEGCLDSERFYRGTIQLPKYTTFPDNSATTINLLCRIQFPSLSQELSTGLSGDVQLAVQVKSVTIYDGETPLESKDMLAVTEDVRKTCVCITGQSRPTATIRWYIELGAVQTSINTSFSLLPKNSHNKKRLYCNAYNFGNTRLAAGSNQPLINVRVKIKHVYIEPASGSTIDIINNIPEPIICMTSGCRPQSTITWRKHKTGQTKDVDAGSVTEAITVTGDLTVTKSTINFRTSKSDDGWILSCYATDFEGTVIPSNNSKTFNILFPPSDVQLSFQIQRLGDSSITVIRGDDVELHCSADSNPVVDLYSWNINNYQEQVLTINDIQRSQTANCTARNSMITTSANNQHGYGSSAVYIDVLYGAKLTSMKVLVDGTPKNTDTVTVEEKSSVSMTCVVDSNPGSTIDLVYANGRLAKQNSKELVYNISSATCSHTSEYTCKASNGVKDGTPPAERKIQLNVKCSPREAIGTDSSVVAQQNTSTVISITLLAYPVPKQYTWYKNSSNTWKKLSNSSAIQLTQASLQFNLTIRNVEAEDYGEYKLSVTNGIGDPYIYVFVLQGHGDQESQTGTPDDGSTGLSGIIGGVVGGLLVTCLVVIGVVCFLRRRNSFEGMKTKLFGPKSTTSRDELNHAGEEIKPQDDGYSYALVDKPKGGKGLNIVKESNVSETMQDAENTTSQPTGYLYSVVNKEAGENKMKIVQEQEAKESAVAKGKTKKTKGEKKKKTKQNAKDNVAAPTGDDDRCYENPMVLTESNTKVKPQKKGKPVKAKDTKPISQDHDGLQYVEVSFSDLKKSAKKKKAAKPKVDDRTVYDAVQFGVVGVAYPSSEEEDKTKK